jgi:hypothetical protein
MSKTPVDRLDLHFIKDKLLEEFAANAGPNDEYTSEIDDSEEKVIIKNKNNLCYEFTQPIYDDGKYIILGGMNRKCKTDGKSGTQNLENVIRFGKKYGYDTFQLTNVASIPFVFDEEDSTQNIDINLTFLKILLIGNSWYSQFKFNNDFTKENEKVFKDFIQLSFREFIERYSRFIDEADKEYYEKVFKDKSLEEKRVMKKEFEDAISSYAQYFHFDMDTIISQCFTRLQKHIYELKMEMDLGSFDEEKMKTEIRKINEFITYVLANIVRIEIGIYGIGTQDVKSKFYGNEMPFFINKKYNNEKVLELLKFKYLDLSLNFREVRGGKPRKTKKFKKAKKQRKTSRK